MTVNKTPKQCKSKANKESFETAKKQGNGRLDELQNNMLLYNLIKEVQKELVAGEEDTIMTILLKVNLRNVINSDPVSSNLVLSDRSGAGKDYIMKQIGKVILEPEVTYFHRTGLSEKAFKYWKPSKDKNFTWDGKVIHIEDPEEDFFTKQTGKTMSSGGSHSVTVGKNLKAHDIEIKGKPVMITTSLEASVGRQGVRRQDLIRLDTTRKQTEAVALMLMLKESNRIIQRPNETLREAIRNIPRREATIPSYIIDAISEHLKKSCDMLEARTFLKKFLDYMKSSAVMYQYQRETNDKNMVVATWFDYDYARLCFIKAGTDKGESFTTVEQSFYDTLKNSDRPLSIAELPSHGFIRSKSWIYKNEESIERMRENKKIIETMVFDEKSNKPIIYYEAIKYVDSETLPNSGFFQHKSMVVESPQREGFSGFIGFPIVTDMLNQLRRGLGLPLLDVLNSFIYIDKTNKTDKTLGNTTFQKHDKTYQNQLSLSNKMEQLKEAIEEGLNTYEDLCSLFSIEFIEKLKEDGKLLSIKGGYELTE